MMFRKRSEFSVFRIYFITFIFGCLFLQVSAQNTKKYDLKFECEISVKLKGSYLLSKFDKGEIAFSKDTIFIKYKSNNKKLKISNGGFTTYYFYPEDKIQAKLLINKQIEIKPKKGFVFLLRYNNYNLTQLSES